MGTFGGFEWVIVIMVVLLLFGAKKIPELARGLGQGISEFRKAQDDIKREIDEGAQQGKQTGSQQNNSKEEQNHVSSNSDTDEDNTAKEQDTSRSKSQ